MEDDTIVYGINDLLTDIAGLYAHGGGDCPEYGITGIVRALELFYNTSYSSSMDKHNIIVLTDAGAKEEYTSTDLSSLIFLLAKSPVKFNFFFSGPNGCGNSYPSYRSIAGLTQVGGIVVEEINENGLDQFIKFVTLTGTSPTNEKRSAFICETFDIPALVNSFQVLIESNQTEVTVITPDNETITLPTIGNSFVVYSNAAPQYGSWRGMCVKWSIITVTTSTN